MGTLADHEWRELLEEQVANHSRLLFRMAFRMVRESNLAEELCQQALLKAWERRDEIREPAALRGWLVRTISNEGLILLRRRQAERRALQARQELKPGIGDQEQESMLLRDELLTAIARLPAEEGAVVSLRLVEGMSGNAVADAMDLSAAEVSRRFTRGLGVLRTELGASLQPERGSAL